MIDDDDIPGDINPDPDDSGFWCPHYLMDCDAVSGGGCHRGYAQCPHTMNQAFANHTDASNCGIKALVSSPQLEMFGNECEGMCGA